MGSEYPRHLTGSGEFTADLSFPGELHGYVLRSPHAHAIIKSTDVAAALASDGVYAVFTGTDLEDAGIGPVPCLCPVEPADGSPMALPPNHALAVGRVRHVGDAVAFIVAADHGAAVNAAEMIDVDYSPLPSVTDATEALSPGAPEVWPEAAGNICYKCEYGDRAATDAAFQRADRVITRQVVFPRVIVNTIEPRAAIAVPEAGLCALYTPSQGAQFLRGLLAGVLGCGQDELHVVTPDVGGAFGMKLFLYPEQILVTHAARVLGKPVKWVGERSSDGFLGDNQSRDQSFDIELALDDSGRFIGIRMRTIANLGAYLSSYGPLNSTLADGLPGPYDIVAGHVEVVGVFTNTVQIDAYRGAGRAELTYPLERIVDAASRETGIDPVQIRRQNFARTEAKIRTNCLGSETENRNYLATLEKAVAVSGWPERARRGKDAALRCRRTGIGLASYAVIAMGAEERVRLSVDLEGAVSVYIGTQSSGQGHEAIFTSAVAEELSIDPDRVQLIQGDTRRYPADSMTGGSRSITAGVPACRKAARAWLEKARQIAATLMQGGVDQTSYDAGTFRSETTDARLDFGGLVRASVEAGLADGGPEPILSVEASHDPGASNRPSGTHICEVEIDPETGEFQLTRYVSVDDIGHVVAPSLAVGQVHGGVTQGLGQAVLEKCLYDSASGQLLSGSLMDYALPRADQAPFFDTLFERNQKSSGLNGLGEMGTVASMPAIMNALNDALFGLGVNEIEAPATPERIWRACRNQA
jgi:carbon-monoxide dehydrogenase large subunit